MDGERCSKSCSDIGINSNDVREPATTTQNDTELDVRDFYEVKELAPHWHVAKSTIYKKITAGQLPSVVIGRIKRISKQTVQEIDERGYLC